ncbi:porin [Tropicimonas marinistellae]|uniref:porin n=1 Tax=Tropicimonas marinistellae TaxID=1739787 RepID=UPI00082AE160|nr:porin [Tropicimonas marinistellae]
MKKVLLASTALVAFAGAAAAEVSLSGSAEMGVVGGKGQDAQFFQDVDVSFAMSGETDGGLTFGTKVDLDEAGKLGDSFSNQGVAIYVSGEFGTVTLGDTDSAFTWAVDSIDSWGNPGSIDDSETAHFGRQGDFLKGTAYDGQVLRYDYTFDAFGFAVSLEQDDSSDFERTTFDADGNVDSVEDAGDYQWAVGASWSPELGGGTLDLGIGYEYAPNGAIGFDLTDAAALDLFESLAAADFTDDEIAALETFFGIDYDAVDNSSFLVNLGEDVSSWGLSAGYSTDNGLSIGGVYADFSGDDLDSGSYWGLGAGYAFEEFSFHVNYGEHSFEGDGGGAFDSTGYGVAAGYDLGGGLSVLAAYGNSDVDIKIFDEKAKTDFDTYSLGLSMSF